MINLPERTDRRINIENEFRGREEFSLQIIEATKHRIGSVGLWMSIRKIVKYVALNNFDDVIIICEDDHVFTEFYERDLFISQIIQASKIGSQILYGGVHGFGTAVPIKKGLYWVDWSMGTQFIVIYRHAFETILNSHFGKKDAADLFLSTHLTNKTLLFPFISRQKEFGYSDVTSINGIEGQMSSRTQYAEYRLGRCSKIVQDYNLLH